MGIPLTKKKVFNGLILSIFIGINLTFVFLQIYKQSQFVKLSYHRQRVEKELIQFNKQREDLVHKLHLKQSSKSVKKYANKNLGMQNTKVAQIHKITL